MNAAIFFFIEFMACPIMSPFFTIEKDDIITVKILLLLITETGENSAQWICLKT